MGENTKFDTSGSDISGSNKKEMVGMNGQHHLKVLPQGHNTAHVGGKESWGLIPPQL